MSDALPAILVIDDLLGRRPLEGRNEERANLCAQLLLEDISPDQSQERQVVRAPIARARFFRGQSPESARVGDVVENDLPACVRVIDEGWSGRQPGTAPWALLLVDLCFYTGPVTTESDARVSGMPEGRADDDDVSSYFGLRILMMAHERFPDLPVVILSSKPREDVAREISRQGALGFISRGEPGSRDELRGMLLRHGLLVDPTDRIVGNSLSLLLALREARRVSAGRRNLLLRGEHGTGKELVARYIHEAGRDARKPFRSIDSGTLSPELFASVLFGHVRGAFTGATADRQGAILQADGGDLFLDEVGNLPADVQAGLLRVLQTREVVPVGAERGRAVDVRFISATNSEIDRIESTGFRPDLLERLRAGGTVALPPLRERTDDIPLLARRFLRDAAADVGGRIDDYSPEALEYLAAQPWPGNVRQLENVIHYAVRSNVDVDFLYPHHFTMRNAPGVSPTLPTQANPEAASGLSLGQVVSALNEFDPAACDMESLAGSIPRLRDAYARVMVGLLRTALYVTGPASGRRVMIQPALRLLTGDSELTGAEAADWIKRLLSISPSAVKDLLEDDILREAADRSRRLRPSRRETPPPSGMRKRGQ